MRVMWGTFLINHPIWEDLMDLIGFDDVIMRIVTLTKVLFRGSITIFFDWRFGLNSLKDFIHSKYSFFQIQF